jgi:CRP-like cAMP-binding protein
MGLSTLQLKNFEKTFDRKTIIFKEGGEGKTLYILMKGSVSVLKGVKKVAEISESGTFFGEMSPLLGTTRTATIITNEVSTFTVIPSQALNTLINDMGIKLSKVLAERLADTTNKMVSAKDENRNLEMRCRSDYQKLVKIIACASEKSKLPQIKSLYEYSKKASFLAKGGADVQIDEMYMDDFIKKSFREYQYHF